MVPISETTEEKGVNNLENIQTQERIKGKIELFLRELEGIREWEAFHILECVTVELNTRQQSKTI